METGKYLWNEKDDIIETSDASTMTHNTSDAIFFVTTVIPVERRYPNLVNNGTPYIFLQILNELIIRNSCISSLVGKKLLKQEINFTVKE